MGDCLNIQTHTHSTNHTPNRRAKCKKIIDHGINVFVNRQLIYNFPEQIFAEAGIMSIEHADFDGTERLALATLLSKLSLTVSAVRDGVAGTFALANMATALGAKLLRSSEAADKKTYREWICRSLAGGWSLLTAQALRTPSAKFAGSAGHSGAPLLLGVFNQAS